MSTTTTTRRRRPAADPLAAELAEVMAEASRLEDAAQAARLGPPAARLRARDFEASAARRYGRKRELLALIGAGGRVVAIRYDEATSAWERRAA